ncbi:MAG: bifunctional diaminohydroxyphosphoribosylaminopyrimidine deaminase/5-amino-6-(5-phosphoribosylamino)uracil reductase RibD [Armatimonadetes bacterium]|nr:bifunctional diaminohydroxyphosphoribosylaminopyrimidine deaminase/5-amino-6-(5-phosphoribosylamino)uracil reductase RibD [Armatimonadota bacterium]
MNHPKSEQWMMEAILLSREGFPAPNPHVGCVIVRDGIVVGRGYHDYAGGPHAEIVALQDAGEKANGAEVYVTQEPCNATGRTGPCSLALIKAGAKKVTIAVPDPNPKMAGGASTLEQAGIQVEWMQETGAEFPNRAWLQTQQNKRPFVVAKAAITRDGFIAREDGTSKWITGPAAREIGHEIRAEMGAVLVGRRTVELDDPELTARLPRVKNQPKRYVVDPRRTLHDTHKIFQNDPAQRIVINNLAHPEDIGLDDLSAPNILSHITGPGLLIEGGAATLSEFLLADTVDQIELFRSKAHFGTGLTWLNEQAISIFKSDWAVARYRTIGDDDWFTFRKS